MPDQVTFDHNVMRCVGDQAPGFTLVKGSVTETL